jgi:hypothetical protein
MASQMQEFKNPTRSRYTNVQLPTSASRDGVETNRSFVLTLSGTFSFEDRPVPELPSQRHVRIRVIATGLCGSDVSASSSIAYSRLDRRETHTESNPSNRFITGNMDALADT